VRVETPGGTIAPPLVVTLDVGSSSVRALAFDAAGRALPSERQAEYAWDTTPDGGVELDAERLLTLTTEVLDGLVADLGRDAGAVGAIAVSTFWHSFLGVAADQRPCTPILLWADTRSTRSVEALRTRIDEKAYHARTGCPLHPSYLPARLDWLASSRPTAFAAARWWMSFGEYLSLRLFGEPHISVSMASGTGLFDQRRQGWDAPILETLGVAPDQLTGLGEADRPTVGLRAPYAARWPTLARVPWFPAWADGACSNVGAGCVGPDRAALMIGTSGAMRVCWETPGATPPPGLWCYRVDRRRILLGGSLSNGGNLYAWLRETLRVGDPAALEREIGALPPDGHGLTVLPFLAGERAPGWRAGARAAVTGLSLATRPVDIARAGLETVGYRFALIHGLLRQACPSVREIVGTGGALTASPVWVQIVTDVLGVPVRPSTEVEGSSRGAALLALHAIGTLPSLAAAPARLGPPVLPDPVRHARYQAGLARHQELYATLVPFYSAGARPSPASPGRLTA
jgi:gluconokinase